jgi:hypothetical protein
MDVFNWFAARDPPGEQLLYYAAAWGELDVLKVRLLREMFTNL